MRCYLLRKGHIAAVEMLNGASDEAVTRQARAVFDERKADYEGFEVWEGARFVYRYPELAPRYVPAQIDVRPFYHLYLLGDEGVMRGNFEFSTDSDEAAYEIAEVAFDSCSDRATQFEVWRQGLRLGKPMPFATLEQVIANRQAQVVALEERMRDSRWAVAKSERLLARLANLETPKVAADHPDRFAEKRSAK